MEKQTVNIKAEQLEVLTKPISHEELKVLYDENPNATLSELVQVSSHELIGLDEEEALDLLSEKLIGTSLLNGIQYEVEGVLNESQENFLLVRVSGFIENMDYFELF